MLIVGAAVGVAAFAAAVAASGGRLDRLRLSVAPESGLVDAPFTVRATGLSSGEGVAITVTGSSHLGKVWRAALTPRADASGRIDLRNRYLLAKLRPVRKPAATDYLPWART